MGSVLVPVRVTLLAQPFEVVRLAGWLKIIRPLRVVARTPRMASLGGKHRLSKAPTAKDLACPAPAPAPFPFPIPMPSCSSSSCTLSRVGCWCIIPPSVKDLRESRPCDKITGYKIFVDIPR